MFNRLPRHDGQLFVLEIGAEQRPQRRLTASMSSNTSSGFGSRQTQEKADAGRLKVSIVDKSNVPGSTALATLNCITFVVGAIRWKMFMSPNLRPLRKNASTSSAPPNFVPLRASTVDDDHVRRHFRYAGFGMWFGAFRAVDARQMAQFHATAHGNVPARSAARWFPNGFPNRLTDRFPNGFLNGARARILERFPGQSPEFAPRHRLALRRNGGARDRRDRARRGCCRRFELEPALFRRRAFFTAPRR